MASLQERARAGDRTTWRLLFRINGKQLSETFEDADEARKWMGIFNAVGAAEGRRMLDAAFGEAPPAGELTVRDLVADHIEALTGIQDGTRTDYRRDAKYDIYPLIGDVSASRLDAAGGREIIERWVNSLASPEREGGRLSGKTISNRHALLSAACERAARKGLIPVNPCRGIRLPEPSPESMVFLTPEEWWQLHDAVPEFWQPFVTLLVGTGLRFGEATALRVRHVDLRHGRLEVVQAWKNRQTAATRHIGNPKSRAGRRTVPFGATTSRALKVMMDGRKPDDLVAVNRMGGPILGSTFHSMWGRALQRADLPRRPRPHDLRHTFASWQLADQDVSIFTLSKIMGHEDVKITANRYGHLIPGSLDSVANAAEAALSR